MSAPDAGGVGEDGRTVLIHRNGYGTSGYEQIDLPLVDGHDLVRHEAQGFHHLSCSCGQWERKDGCGPCSMQSFINHLLHIDGLRGG